jgi:heparin/heparan-sulfate lyase
MNSAEASEAIHLNSPVRVVGIGLLLLALTVPRLLVNYGADGDAIRNVAGAERFAATGVYQPVRLPGSPLFDLILSAVTPWGGPAGANALVLIFFLGSIVVFRRLCGTHPQGDLLVAWYALTPVLVKNAATTMDYIPGLALLLSSYLALRERHVILAAVLLGCSAGMRISNILFVLPSVVFILTRDREGKRAVMYLALAVTLAAALNWPLLTHVFQTGAGIQVPPRPALTTVLMAGYNGLRVWGPVATAVLMVVCLLNANRLKLLLGRRERDPAMGVEVLSILLFLGLYLLMPDEPEYLMPVIPFAYLFLARFVPRAHLTVLAALVFAAGFVSLELKGGSSGRRVLQCRVAPGILVQDFLDRREFEALRNGLPLLPCPTKSVVIAGTDLPLTYGNPHVESVPLDRFPDLRDALRYTEADPHLHRVEATIGKLAGAEVFFVTSLPRHICDRLQAQGCRLYMFDEIAPSYARRLHGYDPEELGIPVLKTHGNEAFFRKNAGPPPAGDRTEGAPHSQGMPGLLRTNRPRLFINRETLPAVRARALGDLRGLYDEQKRALQALGARDPTASLDYGMEAATAAFHFLCEGASNDLALAKALLERSCAYYAECDRSRRRVNWYAFSRIHALAAYDWLYGAMEPDLRARLGRALMDHVERNQPGTAPAPGANLTGYRSGMYGELALLWYAGIALKGAGIDEAKADRGIALGYELNMKMLNYRQQVAGDDGGTATPTLGYALRATPWAGFNFFHTMKSAFGLDIATNWPHAALLPNYVIWNLLPGGREFGAGDASHHDNLMQVEQLYTHCAQIRHFYGATEPTWAALAAWIQEKCPSHTYFVAVSPIAPFLLTGLDESPPAAAPPTNLPSARHFAGLGQIFMRSGQEDDDTYALFTVGGCTDGMLAHRHYDQNTFTIFRSGFLAIDSGSRPEPGNHLFQYYGRSVAHNAVLIRMDGEVPPRYWGDPAPGESAVPANDGGMCSLTGAVVRAFATTPEYTYIAGDATACYIPAKCRLATRQFLHIQPDMFVVFDRVSAVKPEFRKAWLLHTVREPTVMGSTFTAEHGEGRLFCRTLLPTNAVLEKIGGPGKEFWSDGRNWPLPAAAAGQSPPPLPQTELMGGWRIEVAPAVTQADDCFLHWIEVGGLAKTNLTPARLLQETDWAGVELTHAAATWRVRFRTQGDLGAELTIVRGTNTLIIPLPNRVQTQSGLALTNGNP